MSVCNENSRADLLEAIRLHPCHVTGQHVPNHHLVSDRVCSIQKQDLFDQILNFFDIKLEDIDRAVHPPACGWCNDDGHPSKHREAHAKWAARSKEGQ